MSKYDEHYAEGSTKGSRRSYRWTTWALVALGGAGLLSVIPLLVQAFKDAAK